MTTEPIKLLEIEYHWTVFNNTGYWSQISDQHQYHILISKATVVAKRCVIGVIEDVVVQLKASLFFIV